MSGLSRVHIVLIGVVGVLLVVGIGLYVASDSLFSAPQSGAELERLVVPLSGSGDIIPELLADGYIKSETGLQIALWLTGKNLTGLSPGAYRISKSMTAWEIADALTTDPYMKWVVIPEGFRKEQIAELLADTLGWSDEQVITFVTKDTAQTPDTEEGVYFPDTYLIPLDESTLEVAERLYARFNEKFAPYGKEAVAQNIRWPTVIKLASLVQREAAGKSDMPLIAGILWNRLLKDQRLELDATVQYSRDTAENYDMDGCSPSPCSGWELTYHGEGAADNGWWRPIKVADKDLIPFNTYRNKGLPERPISNPGLQAIAAVLEPEETDCFFYLHDSGGQIHCAVTYEEHQENIEEYLR